MILDLVFYKLDTLVLYTYREFAVPRPGVPEPITSRFEGNISKKEGREIDGCKRG